MKKKFHVFIRQHWNDWYTASLLIDPRYSAYGPHPSELLEEIGKVLARDLAGGDFPETEAYFPKLSRRTVSLELKAHQHDRLTTVPMRFSVLTRPLDVEHLFEVRIPRIQSVFTIFGEDNIDPWVEETIRGRFHFSTVDVLLEHQYEKNERLEEIEVAPRGGKKARRQEDADELARASHPLEALGIDLTAEAQAGRLQAALFREPEVQRLIGAISSRRAPSALLVGASGAGKTTIVHALAQHFVDGRVPPLLAGAKLWQVTGGRIVAGATFLGDWQERARTVVEMLSASRDVLYLGDLTELITAGTRKSGLDVASFFVSPIESGELIAIAETTFDGLTLAQRTHPELVRAFQHLPVEPLSLDRSRSLIERRAAFLSRDLGVGFAPESISAALELTSRFSPSDSFPGATIELVDRMARLHTDRKRTVSREDAVRAFSKISGFPEELVDPDRKMDVGAVSAFFRERVIGQEHATDLLASLLLLLKAGLNDPEKPLGSFLFMGPTGVGKTESALTLAEYLFGDRDRVVRFDMSEYGYPGSALRLVDGPDGEGDLTRRVREQPFSVLLFDELEKADPGVFDLLLQLLGEGRLTDGTGKTVSFVHTIPIMTSNLGTDKKQAMGFGDLGGNGHFVEAAERFFRPELVNRIDHLVPFSRLSRADLRRIARRLLDAAIAREGFSRRSLEITYDAVLLDHLAEIGFDARYGARPMKRAVESFVVVPLAKRLVSTPMSGALRLSLRDGALLLA